MEAMRTGSAALGIACAGLVNVLAGVTTIWAQSHPGPSHTVKGEVSSVEGRFHMGKGSDGLDKLDIFDNSYVITNQAGETMRLQLTDRTRVESRVNPGDRIEANISQEGYTLSVRRIE
jgi:hypothetical protein